MLVARSNPIELEKDRTQEVCFSSDWSTLSAPVKSFLQAVGSQLREQVLAFEPEIASFAEYALLNQGKQLRPTLVGCAGEADHGFESGLVKVAVIIEMIHLATLVHDDIMDQAILRRNRPTLCEHSGHEVSVLLGDCLFSRALELASEFPTTDVCRLVSQATRNVCSGEILQTLRYKKRILNQEDYLRTIRLKTAELFALSCELGGSQIGLSVPHRDALKNFGFALGTAYQIYDDCLDIFGDESEVGKSLGTDLQTGKCTLPILLLQESMAPQEKEALLSKLFVWDESQRDWLMGLFARHQTLEACIRVIEQHLYDAERALELLKGDGHGLSLEPLLKFLSSQATRLGH